MCSAVRAPRCAPTQGGPCPSQIRLHDPGRQDTVIIRTLQKRDGGATALSSYKMSYHGKALDKATVADVRKRVQGFGIYVDNSCQVLPQEAIATFVNSSPESVRCADCIKCSCI